MANRLNFGYARYRRGTTAQWAAANPVLGDGEPGVITDVSPRVLKIGDGTTRWADLPVTTANATIDLTAEVVQTGSIALGGGDLYKMHTFTISYGTTRQITLPPANQYTGMIVGICVTRSSGGLLQFLATPGEASSLVVDWLTDDFWMWGGESVLLLARSDGWHIVDGTCRPLFLRATRTGASNLAVSSGSLEITGFATDYAGTFWRNGLHALNGSGQIRLPRRSAYQIYFSAAVTWTTTAPSNLYATLGENLATGNYETESLTNRLVQAHWQEHGITGQIVKAIINQTGGSGVEVFLTAMPARITVAEIPQW